MHYHAEVWVSEIGDITRQVAKIMGPHEEAYNEENESLEGFWDWWQIGGRWTGAHSDYDPAEDERNVEVCDICNGTGFRRDALGNMERLKDITYTCNGCGRYDMEAKAWTHGDYGSGKCLKWPTQWARHDGDIIPVDQVPDDLSCYTLMVDGKVFHKEEWGGENLVKTDFDGNVANRLQELGISDGFLVTVDYHC